MKKFNEQIAKKDTFVYKSNERNRDRSKQVLYCNMNILKKLLNETSQNQKKMLVDSRMAIISNYGPYIAVKEGFNSTSENRLEISFPNNADISINQKKGFTIFFWVIVRKSPGGVHRFIIKKGNLSEELTPSVGILPENTNFFVKLNTNKGRTESLYSTKQFEFERLYNISVVFDIDYQNDLTDVILYIDGLLNSQITVPGQPLHNHGHLSVGKPDDINHGFKGWIADVIIIPKILKDEEISKIVSFCLHNLQNTGYLKSCAIIEELLQYNYLIEKYSETTKIPVDILKNSRISNVELKEVFRSNNIEFGENVEEQQINRTKEQINILKLKNYMGDETSIVNISIKNLYTYSQFIYTILSLSIQNQTENPSLDEFEDKMRIDRIMNIFFYLEDIIKVKLDSNNLTFLAKLTETYSKYEEKNDKGGLKLRIEYIKIYDFFNSFINLIKKIYPNLKFAEFSEKSNKFEINSVSLHEKLLIESQKYKFVDYDSQKDLEMNSYSIKNYYKRKNYNEDENNNTQQINSHLLEDVHHNNHFQGSNSGFENNSDNVNFGSDNKKESSDEEMEMEGGFDKNDGGFDKNDDESSKKGVSIDPPQENNDNIDMMPQAPSSNSNPDVLDNPEVNDNKFDMNSTQKLELGNSNDFTLKNNLGETNKSNEIINNQIENSKISQDYKIDAKFDENWNQGEFQIYIKRCYNCHNHKRTTHHYEHQFIDKFNKIGNEVKETFPNIIILEDTNYPDYYGQFDVYIRGIGIRQDSMYNTLIFSLKDKKRFPSKEDITDLLISFSMVYGGSCNLDQTQKAMLKDKPQFVEKPNLHPIEASEEINKIKMQIEEYRKLKVSILLYRKIKVNHYLIKLNSFA